MIPGPAPSGGALVSPRKESALPLGWLRVPAAGAFKTALPHPFQIVFGPHNGCVRATLFLGYVPPGRAPWHYHLYDEIVLIRRGLARVHRADGTTEEASAGVAFRLAPREVHIIENAGVEELALLGLFTPAGSPSAAYVPPEAPGAET